MDTIRKRAKTKMSLPYPHCIEGCRFTIDGACKYREMHVPTIAVDFDKVLFTHESWQGHHHYGEPIPGARETLLELQERGFKIMIWTTRDQSDIIAEACNKHNIPYDYINQNPNQPPEINPSKPVADYYIDDRALHFRSWEQVLKEINAREVHDPYYAETLSVLDVLEKEYTRFLTLADKMIEDSQTPGAYMGYISQRLLLESFIESIQDIRTNPQEVIERGRKEGWLK